MRVFFDARYIRTDFHDGISRYSLGLGSALSKITDVTFVICDRAQVKLLPEGSSCMIIHSPTSIKEPLTARFLNKHRPDVVVSPMQTMGSGGRNFKLVLALHDMIYYRHRTPPRGLNPAIRLGWRAFHLSYIPQRLTLNGADRVLTVSETSRRDIKNARLTKRPVIVAPNAPQDLQYYLKNPVKQLQTAPKNLIYMGSFMPYKGVETLIDAMEFLPDRTLHFLSKIDSKRHRHLKKQVKKGSSIIFHNGVNDKEYAELLADNALLVSASRDEGYGLPVAEALSLGVPAVISDINIFHEIAGNGAKYFEPNDSQDFARVVRQLDSKEVRKKLVERGKKHIAQYSWDNSARILLDELEKMEAK